MKFTDQFTIRLTSSQHDLMTSIFTEIAALDLPPCDDPEFDTLWDSVIEAEHQIISE